LRDFEGELTLKESQLNSLRIDASDLESVRQLKGLLNYVVVFTCIYACPVHCLFVLPGVAPVVCKTNL